ncbi:MAG: hypothetical protein SVX43_18235, partial [Cyanobacteriota bacterium]|nr:hypothetical protein [Cyanobacteriota bacterium]
MKDIAMMIVALSAALCLHYMNLQSRSPFPEVGSQDRGVPKTAPLTPEPNTATGELDFSAARGSTVAVF